MAKVHNQISRGDVTNAVQRALGITKPDTAGVERYGETLGPVLDIWRQPEWAFLRGERLQGFSASVGAIAAEFGYAALVNPAGSNVIVVVEAVMAFGTAFYQVELAQEATWAATLAAILPGGIFRDTRWFPGALGGSARIRTGTDPSSVLGTSIDQQRNLPAINLPVVLGPGWGLAVAADVVNVVLPYVFGWRERKAYPGELGTP
jgi:hypothetical protein